MKHTRTSNRKSQRKHMENQCKPTENKGIQRKQRKAQGKATGKVKENRRKSSEHLGKPTEHKESKGKTTNNTRNINQRKHQEQQWQPWKTI